ncbi:ornithine cyclodeaminase [Mumia flava]|uniref:Ornithine cyclodeaminase n=1 Tax=Mumia flava TaxID=1348852 RepID=A0A0B2B2G7_9ACTN|nr:hypothetical protein [Mumia flava]PJJ57917.1 ornithine cyclodeaminase [Mumia flava]
MAILTDTELLAGLRARDAVRWMRDAALAHHRGELVGPPRVSAPLGDGALVVTAGALRGRWYGYRSRAGLAPGGDEITVVQEHGSGRVLALAAGRELGPRRTGAIGGAAADALARPDASVLALVGAGTQAWTQLWAVAAVRDLREVRVHVRTPERRDAFARRAREVLGIEVTGFADARTAVDGADLVVCATTSTTPVVERDWLAPGAYLATLGPKQPGAAEVEVGTLAACDAVVTDSPAQLLDGSPTSNVVGTEVAGAVVALGAVIAGDAQARRTDADVVAFSSVGLAGTEPYLLARYAGVA